MQTVSSGTYLSTQIWMRDATMNEQVILRGVSALEYLQLFVGYLGVNELDVYALSVGMYENINYHIVDNFGAIDFINDGYLLCSTVNQAVNDLLADFENTDEEALANALSNYYHRNNESFSGLYIRPENAKYFDYVREWAVNYYNDSF